MPKYKASFTFSRPGARGDLVIRAPEQVRLYDIAGCSVCALGDSSRTWKPNQTVFIRNQNEHIKEEMRGREGHELSKQTMGHKETRGVIKYDI